MSARGMTTEIDQDLFQWIVGGLTSVLSAFGFKWMHTIQSKVDDLERSFNLRNERIKALETHTDIAIRRFDRIEDQLEEIKQLLLAERKK